MFGEDPPTLVHDLDRDGLAEIVKPFANEVYWNRGAPAFETATATRAMRARAHRPPIGLLHRMRFFSCVMALS